MTFNHSVVRETRPLMGVHHRHNAVMFNPLAAPKAEEPGLITLTDEKSVEEAETKVVGRRGKRPGKPEAETKEA